ncbi:hypothetical protein Nepgr_029969 [Nepenthes gracilis]|uniref:ascorbate ferrireductase (transmembrane) n=1 Tax=Nepenthes gracilis TaxID=150966 RepID=A0AAD3Y641_NEPGR|nr:hypothetical protein Nepgr_029969 [Nepenthes gracilis]
MAVKPVLLTFVAHALAVAAAAMVLVWCIHFRGGFAWKGSNKTLIFNNHPVLMLIGFIIIGGEAAMAYKSLPLRKEVQKVVHLTLHAVALALGIVGIYAVFKFHDESHITNLYSLHSWFGLGIIVLYAIQWIFGFVMFFWPGGGKALKNDSRPWHVLFGTFLFTLAVGNSTLGFLEKLTFLEMSGVARHGSEAYLVNFTAIAAVLYGAFVLLTLVSSTDQVTAIDKP